MVEYMLLFSVFVSFCITMLSLPSWIRRAKQAGLTGRDMHKKSEAGVAEAGGVCVVAGFVLGLFYYLALITFYYKSAEHVIEIFALTSVVMIVAFIGMVDDILGWKLGLGKKARIFLVLFAAIPLMVINAGHSDVFIPFKGSVDVGLLYPLIFVPLGILGASVSYNFVAGYNGLEASQGILILTALSVVAYFTGNSWLAIVLMCMIASLIAFYFYNRNPAKVFPGDTMTYSIGAVIACVAILGNFEKIAVFFFIPYIAEVLLKATGKLKKESFAKLNEDGSIDMPYSRIYGIEHLAIYLLKKVKNKVYERDVVYFVNGLQLVFILVGFLIFKNSIFIR